ncbi:hypothetical protein THARTR1_03122 [Trichoderma harzianum]|uniref:C2H2-type domain-containing protein n=1 Tax=Trichoderma harzianum TaxID=5544 RepID=A0A2K0UGC6_TRIHA|nr:hypothetical protein THARTR1_03122 [Trichoderma harzianum]
MEVTLRYTKGWQKRPNTKTFILTEVDALIFDPIILMIIIGILDNAFDANIKSVDDIYRVRVQQPRRSYEFRWKEEKMEIPIFRQAVMTAAGVRTSETIALRYHTYLYYLQRLGINAGFMQVLTSYMIRRGAGESVEVTATQAQLQQVMSHRDAGVYQAYINQRVQCHVQAAFLSQPSAQALFKAVTHMSRYVDPRAPIELTSDEAAKLRLDPEVGKLKELRDQLSKEIRSESGTIKKAEIAGTKLYQLYKKAGDALKCAKEKMTKSAKRHSRAHYFNTIDTIEINKQLEDNTQLGLGADGWKPPEVEHHLAERKEVAGLICEEIKLEHRIRTANAILSLCRKKEPPRRRIPVQSKLDEEASPLHCPISQSCAKTQCIFCIRNGDSRHFSSVYKTRDHVEIHLSTYREGDLIPCPWAGCEKDGIMLKGHMHCKSHAARAPHDYDIFRRRWL